MLINAGYIICWCVQWTSIPMLFTNKKQPAGHTLILACCARHQHAKQHMLVNSYACLFCRGVHLSFLSVFCSLLVFAMYKTVKQIQLYSCMHPLYVCQNTHVNIESPSTTPSSFLCLGHRMRSYFKELLTVSATYQVHQHSTHASHANWCTVQWKAGWHLIFFKSVVISATALLAAFVDCKNIQ